MIRKEGFKGDASRVLVKRYGLLKECTRVIHVVNGVAYIIWQSIIGFIFTKDGAAIRTKDGAFIRTKDQR